MVECYKCKRKEAVDSGLCEACYSGAYRIKPWERARTAPPYKSQKTTSRLLVKTQKVAHVSRTKPEIKIKFTKDQKGRIINCTWVILTPDNIEMIRKLLLEVKDWSDLKVMNKFPLDDENVINLQIPNEIRLSIVGPGHNNKCIWCRFYWTAFKNKVRQKYNLTLITEKETKDITIDWKKKCIFEDGGRV